MTWDEVCALAAELPGVEPGRYHGYPALRVAGKFLTRLGDDGESLEFKGLEPIERDLLLESAPEIYFLPAGFGGAGVFARLSALDGEHLRPRLESAWRRVAPAALLKASPVTQGRKPAK